MIIVSLSSIPSRFNDLNLTLNSLLNQTIQPDKIELYIPYRYKRFPEWDGSLPNVPNGVDIIRCEIDFGPATKVLPAIKRHRTQNATIIYCDDDREYHNEWLESFINEQRKKPTCAIANYGWSVSAKPFSKKPLAVKSIFDVVYRLKRFKQSVTNCFSCKKQYKPQRTWRFIKGGYIDIMEGYGGCLIKPSMLDESVFEIPDIAWPHDDIWLSGKLAEKGVKIWQNPRGKVIDSQHHEVKDALNKEIFDGLNRDELTSTLINYMRERFHIWENSK